MAFRDSTHAAVFARCKEERNAACHVRVDLCIQHLEIHLEQRAKQHWYGDQIEEEPRRRCEALLGEGWQRAELIGLLQLAEQPHSKFSAEITRRSAHGARQIREAARFRDS